MKKILLLSEIFPPEKGGSGRWFWEVYTRAEHSDVVIAAGKSTDAEEFDQNNPLKTYRLPLSSPSWGVKSFTGLKFYWRVYRLVNQIVKQNDIETIHCGRCLPEGVVGYLFKMTKGLPYVCFVHGEDVEAASTSRELSWIVRKSLREAKYLVCNSHNTAKILTGNWNVPTEKVQVIHPGVDVNYFVPADANTDIRATLGWMDRPVVLTVGRLQKRKGHDMMIKALAEIKRSIPNVLYVIIGDGELRLVLEEMVHKLGLDENVMFMAEVSDELMLQCYQQCDLFILPNRTVGKDIEGFGMVLVEAQACGKPVIAGDSGGTMETMQVGESGYIVDCTSTVAISEKVVQLLNNKVLIKQMGKKGIEYVNAKLDWTSLSKQAKKLFDSV